MLPSNGACEPGMQCGLSRDSAKQVADSRHVQKLRLPQRMASIEFPAMPATDFATSGVLRHVVQLDATT